jgi:hypothetical protein
MSRVDVSEGIFDHLGSKDQHRAMVSAIHRMTDLIRVIGPEKQGGVAVNRSTRCGEAA